MAEVIVEIPELESEQDVKPVHPNGLGAQAINGVLETGPGIEDVQIVPEGWFTVSGLAKEIERNPQTVQKALEGYLEENPEYVGQFIGSNNRVRTFISPEAVSVLRHDLRKAEDADEGWFTINQLQKELGRDYSTIKNIVDRYSDEHPEWTQTFNAKGRRASHCSPELVGIIRDELAETTQPPDGWTTETRLAKDLGKDFSTVRRIVAREKDEHPEWFGDFRAKGTAVTTYIGPELVELIKAEIDGKQIAPQDWISRNQLARQLGIPKQTIGTAAKKYIEEHPEWSQSYRNQRQITAEHYSPDLVNALVTEFAGRIKAPEGWMTSGMLCDELGKNDTLLRRIINEYREEHPEWFASYVIAKGHVAEHLAPELVTLIKAEAEQYVEPTESWVTLSTLAKQCDISQQTTRDRLELLREEHPDSFRSFANKAGRLSEYISPEVADLIREQFAIEGRAPEGWLTANVFGNAVGKNGKLISSIAETYRSEYPEWFQNYRNSKHSLFEHYHPELQLAITTELESREVAPEGWEANRSLALKFRCAQETMQAIANLYRDEHPEWFRVMYGKHGHVFEYMSPELIREIEALAEYNNNLGELAQQNERLKEELVATVVDIGENNSIDSTKIRDLIDLFGAERAIDIIYQFHPEYKKVPVPYVRSVIADYLGDFLIIRGELQIDKLETGVEYLSDQNLRDGLIEVVKNNCLTFYNQLKKIGSTDVDLDILTTYIDHLRQQTSGFTTQELAQVFDEVETYFSSLFEITKPDQLVDELKEGRTFPDLNQRINIKEIESKQRMLIADEMGVGKSASVILAKESLGVKRALIVVPSNVVEVWQTYLSDKQNGNGNGAKGYFKPGEAPKVLTVESIKDLQGINADDYDYVILSHERLTDRYRKALEHLGFDMLIVDEAHKLKNLISGRRADNLVKLAEVVNSEDSAQYLTLLSGTPVPNKVGDIAMVLKLLYPDKFEYISNKELTAQILQGDVLDLRSLLVPRMQMKALAESVDMPKLEDRVHSYKLSPQAQEVYDVLLDEDELTATEKLHILRKFVLNPRLFTDSIDFADTKASDVGDTLRHAFETKDKVVMFVNGYIQDIIRGDNTIFPDFKLPEDVVVRNIDGYVSKSKRLAIQKELKKPGKMLLAVSGQTADVGVDFSAADELIFYNEPWTEYDKLQQRGRVYRPGLTKDLISSTHITAGTIEEGIHFYIKSKYEAVEKLLRGIPISQLERELLANDEKSSNPNLEFNPDIAKFYLSSVERMLRFFSYGKQGGETNFAKFTSKYGKEYAETYSIMGRRSYQANVSRLAGTVIDGLVKSRKQNPAKIRILDVASGPEVLKQHIGEEYQKQVYSLDYNEHHFSNGKRGKKTVGSFLNLPIADKTIDYANLALSWHYTSFAPTRQDFERLEVLREINRVLAVGGRTVISLTNNLDLKNPQTFYEAVSKLGFKVVKEYTGDVRAGTGVRTRLITLEKVKDCEETVQEDIKQMGSPLLQGLKLKKTGTKLKDARKIATTFVIDESKKIRARINEHDRKVLDEEQKVLAEMEKLKVKYGDIESIPEAEISQRGYARTFNSKNYLLFKYLRNGNGAVIVR